jgi:hypothetical protein
LVQIAQRVKEVQAMIVMVTVARGVGVTVAASLVTAMEALAAVAKEEGMVEAAAAVAAAGAVLTTMVMATEGMLIHKAKEYAGKKMVVTEALDLRRRGERGITAKTHAVVEQPAVFLEASQSCHSSRACGARMRIQRRFLQKHDRMSLRGEWRPGGRS